MHALRVGLLFDEVNCGVVSPDNRIGFIAEVPRESEHVTIERHRSRDVLNVEHWRALDKLPRI